MTPNPSVEARPNGRPPGPGWWYAYIFTSPGLASCRRSRLTSNVRRHQKTMLPLETSISTPLKVQGFRKRARTWWRDREETIQILNLQKSPFGERLYINLGVYVRQLGQESRPAAHNCHVQTRLELAADERYWNVIVSAESESQPPQDLVTAVLTDGVAWVDQVSSIEGILSYLSAGGSKKGMVVAAVRNLVRHH